MYKHFFGFTSSMLSSPTIVKHKCNPHTWAAFCQLREHRHQRRDARGLSSVPTATPGLGHTGAHTYSDHSCNSQIKSHELRNEEML